MVFSKIFFYTCLAFLGGIFLNSFFYIPQILIIFFLILGIFLMSVFWGKKMVVVFGIFVLFFAFGIFRHQSAELGCLKSELTFLNDKEEVFLTGIVVGEPDEREDNVKLTFQPEDMSGKILITVNKYLGYEYGDRLAIRGKLLTPAIFKDFNYKNYLIKDGIYSVMYAPEVEVIERNKGNIFYTGILSIKEKFKIIINENLSPPQSAILGSIILGEKKQINSLWKEKLNMSGLRHITAVSGMHVVILSGILNSFLLGIGLRRREGFFMTLFFLFCFIAITGFQVSALRAGLMAFFLLLSRQLGRMNSSLRTIVFAAVIILMQNPLLLRLDVGFQLSFLAALGIVCFLPILNKLFKKIPNVLQAKGIVLTTVSAQFFTLPILVYNFGYFPSVSLFANLLVVPIIPIVMGLGFTTVLLGTIFHFLAGFIFLPIYLLLTYVVKIIDFTANLPFNVLYVEISWVWLIIAYIVLFFTIRHLRKNLLE